jgi:hypothetical protein
LVLTAHFNRCQAQVAIKGAQDIYLISPSDLTFWKTTYARHTNFAVGEVEMQFNNAAGFGRQKFTCKVSRSGDLLAGMYVAVTLPRIVYPPILPLPLVPPTHLFYNPAFPGGQYAFWVNAIGHAMLTEVSVNIGAHEFDDHFSEFMEMWESLTAPSDRLLSQMTGRFAGEAACAEASLQDQTLFIPMRFWFNRFPEQSLPLVALYWHDVELTFSTRNLAQLFQARGIPPGNIQIGGTSAVNVVIPDAVSDMHMLCNLVYLDRPERAAFANSKSEYVIDQVQFLGAESIAVTANTINHSIRFNHPVQEIIWAIRTDAAVIDNDWFNFWGNTTAYGTLPAMLLTDPFRTASITINNHTRTAELPAMYYRQVQPYQAHARFPAPDRCVYCYSFGLKPEEMLHTGSVNMSRLDNAQLRITYNGAGDLLHPPVAGSLFIFARNKNVAKITVGYATSKHHHNTILIHSSQDGRSEVRGINQISPQPSFGPRNIGSYDNKFIYLKNNLFLWRPKKSSPNFFKLPWRPDAWVLAPRGAKIKERAG